MLVQFVPFVSLVEPALWHAYARLKLNELRLDDSQIPVTASYAPPLAVRDESADLAVGCTLRLGADGLRACPCVATNQQHTRSIHKWPPYSVQHEPGVQECQQACAVLRNRKPGVRRSLRLGRPCTPQ